MKGSLLRGSKSCLKASRSSDLIPGRTSPIPPIVRKCVDQLALSGSKTLMASSGEDFPARAEVFRVDHPRGSDRGTSSRFCAKSCKMWLDKIGPINAFIDYVLQNKADIF
ncbi:hypothetical protein pipiens_009877 [Culex pipiens pipiens]|uniref:Uncharacterized protein n=1 Tax=Culex pipiens pipiens TaxID=38569 RepID=A0ABD1DC90_CULPP